MTTPQLPSASAALSFIAAPSAAGLARVVGTTLVRGALIAGGLFAAGVRGVKLLEYAAAGASAVELGVIAWAVKSQVASPPLAPAPAPQLPAAGTSAIGQELTQAATGQLAGDAIEVLGDAVVLA
jgi:hypothetical protein